MVGLGTRLGRGGGGGGGEGEGFIMSHHCGVVSAKRDLVHIVKMPYVYIAITFEQ